MGTLASMLVLAGQIFGALLVATGVAKLRRPADTTRALSAVGLPFPRQTTWGVAIAEVVVGSLALFLPSPGVFAVQGMLYLGFLAWVILALRSGAPIASCGCLGRDDTPPGGAHIAVDVIGVLASSGAVLTFPTRPEYQGLAMVAALSVVLVGASLGWMVLGDAATSLSRGAS